MRITGGAARGISLVLPKGDRVRPATDALRQAVFSSLGARVAGARFLDLFAGSGAYGLEAFSRGAAGGSFVEKDARTADFIRRNVTAVTKSMARSPDALRVVSADATTFQAEEAPDVVFIDPPYEIIPEVAPRLLARLALWREPKPDLLVVFEMPGDCKVAAPGWVEFKRLGKGARQPTAAFFRFEPVLPPPA